MGYSPWGRRDSDTTGLSVRKCIRTSAQGTGPEQNPRLNTLNTGKAPPKGVSLELVQHQKICLVYCPSRLGKAKCDLKTCRDI